MSEKRSYLWTEIKRFSHGLNKCPLDTCLHQSSDWCRTFESHGPTKIKRAAWAALLILVGVRGFEPLASWTRIKTHLFNIVLLYLKSVDFMRLLWYHCVVKFYSVVYLFVSLFTQVFTFGR